jgi:fermentation-respiration switch protein FrsA (DUF1100 family)
MTPARREITFPSAGETCRGWLYPPAGPAPWPTVVMAHGFSAVKEMRLDRFAEAFAAAGLASLVFDYRGFGTSDGAPRGDVDPLAQIEDYRNAISAARALAEVDRDRIGIWGTSYSGAHALSVAAVDSRVKVVVAQVPMVDGWETFRRMLGDDGLADLERQLVDERERIQAGGEPARIAVVSDTGEVAALGTPDAYEWFTLAAQTAPSWRNEVTLRSLERLLEYAPGRWIDRIAPRPLLVIAAADDFLPRDLTERAFALAGEPKRLLVLPGGHFAGYEPPQFAVAANAACEWFAEHLTAKR